MVMMNKMKITST